MWTCTRAPCASFMARATGHGCSSSPRGWCTRCRHGSRRCGARRAGPCRQRRAVLPVRASGNADAGLRHLSLGGMDVVLRLRVMAWGGTPFCWHDFRRTVAGRALDSGATVEAVQRHLGHASAAQTLAYTRQRDSLEQSGTVADMLASPFEQYNRQAVPRCALPGHSLVPPQRPGRRLRPSQATSHGVTGLLPGHAQAPRALRTKPRAAGSRHRGLASRDGRQRWCLSKALSELKSWPQARQPASAPRGSLTTGASWSCVGSPPAAGRGGDGASCVAPGQSSPPETPPG
jgi:hypothetical protein